MLFLPQSQVKLSGLLNEIVIILVLNRVLLNYVSKHSIVIVMAVIPMFVHFLVDAAVINNLIINPF